MKSALSLCFTALSLTFLLNSCSQKEIQEESNESHFISGESYPVTIMDLYLTMVSSVPYGNPEKYILDFQLISESENNYRVEGTPVKKFEPEENYFNEHRKITDQVHRDLITRMAAKSYEIPNLAQYDSLYGEYHTLINIRSFCYDAERHFELFGFKGKDRSLLATDKDGFRRLYDKYK